MSLPAPTLPHASLSNHAAAQLGKAIEAAGLTPCENWRYDGVSYEGTIEQWAQVAEAAVALYAVHGSTERRVLRAAFERNPAGCLILQALNGYAYEQERLARVAARAARLAARG